MPLPIITMLSNMQTGELSLVKRGANKKRFALTKSETAMSLKAVLATAAEGEEKLVAHLKSEGANADRIEAVVAQYRITKGFADMLEPEDLVAVAKSAGVELVLKADDEEADDEEDDDKPAFLKEKLKKKGVKKSADLANLDPEVRAQVEAVFKSNEELSKKSERLEAVVKSLQDGQRTEEFVAKAKLYTHIPGKPEELATIMKSLEDVDPGLSKGFEKMLSAMNEVVEKSQLLSSSGISGSSAITGVAGGAWAKIEALADGIVQKSADVKITKAQAVERILKSDEGKALYHQYLGENPAQRAKANY